MVKVIFKNVGQGDSIILEWEDGEKIKTAIVDCNIYKGRNPVLEHIIEKEIREIEFVILTHPHSDHFSGFYGLLSFCRDHNVRVKRFMHTSEIPDFMKSATRSLEADDDLFRLFSLIREMRDSSELKLYTIDDNEDLKIPLGDYHTMEVLSPSSIERDNYVRGIKFPFDEEEGSNNPNANWLSTILKIYSQNYAVILTSDVESSALTRIGKKQTGRIGADVLAMAQVPHHGSKGNLNNKFWQLRKRPEITPIVISVGENGYKHPSVTVVSFFDITPNYQIISTNMTGALLKESERTKIIIDILDIISVDESVIVNDKYNGDKIFILSESDCVLAS